MSLIEQINTLKALLNQCEVEVLALVAGKKASAPRIRKHSQLIKAGAHNLRKLTTIHLGGMPTKSYTKDLNRRLMSVETMVEPVVEPPTDTTPDITPEVETTKVEPLKKIRKVRSKKVV